MLPRAESDVRPVGHVCTHCKGSLHESDLSLSLSLPPSVSLALSLSGCAHSCKVTLQLDIYKLGSRHAAASHFLVVIGESIAYWLGGEAVSSSGSRAAP